MAGDMDMAQLKSLLAQFTRETGKKIKKMEKAPIMT